MRTKNSRRDPSTMMQLRFTAQCAKSQTQLEINMTVNPETVNSDSNSDNDEQHGQTQQGRGEVNQAEVTGQVPEGTGQAQDQGNTGATGGQEEHQNNGTAEEQQDQTSTHVDTEGQMQGAESLEERRTSNRNLLRRFLQEVDEDTQAAPSLRDRERHRRISRPFRLVPRDGGSDN